ncbi:MAG TPA: DsbE family thiol:disulfide interchange protein [Pyrinomonadaceae bacterium]|nr:DsbE family thiol:disulfide interchange protein [Pyrinomonadaceae bacterium]
MAEEVASSRSALTPVLYAVPLVVFLVIAGFLASRLRGGYDPHIIPSALIGKPAPEFQLAQLGNPAQSFSPQQMRGKVWLLNVWGSWCVACREEHPYLMELSRSGVVPIYGLSWKDKREDALSTLQELGDPYVLSVSDFDGKVAIDYGITGAPETYVIDQNGTIRYKEVGQLNPEVMQTKILPLIKKLTK